jgi:23S rRNA (cytosine1962-C5)-methyltransferase
LSALRGSIVLRAGRERSLARHHPWIFSGAIERIDGKPDAGDTVAVISSTGDFLAWAAYSPHSQIRARVWSWVADDAIDAAFFHARIQRAVNARTTLGTDAIRLVHGEADGLPGVIADRYRDALVLQLATAGAEHWREAIVDAIVATTGCATVLERSDVDVRALEGLPLRVGTLRGSAPASTVEIREHGLRYRVDLAGGQKTGFYLDQRANRARIGALAAGRSVLNAFCYTGGFTLNALAGGAEAVLSIDSSAGSRARGRENEKFYMVEQPRKQRGDPPVFV